jgi:Berberine and berberine like
VMRAYREWVGGAPDELTTLVNLLTCPPAPFLPEEWHGRPLVAIVGMHKGPADVAERALQPMRQLGAPVADLFGPMPYVAMQSLIDPLWGPGAHSYMKAGFLRELDDRTIDTLVAEHAAVTSPKTEIHIQHLGGAVARVAPHATAFGERDAPFILNIVASTFTADGYDDAVDWAQGTYSALAPSLTGAAYVNFLSNEGQERVRAAFDPATYDRLVALKDEYDPDNVFRLNQNVRPSSGGQG